MNLAIFAIVAIAFFGAIVDAYPQQTRFQRVPYYPPPTRPPRPIRVRRQVLVGKLSSNPKGGADARLQLAKGIGTPDHNLIASVFAAGNTQGGPVGTGGTLAYNNNGLGLALSKQHIPGVRDILTQSAKVKLFSNGVHSVDANVFKSQNTLPNGFKFQRNGAGIEYSHKNGHRLGLSQSSIPNFGKQLELSGKANLWSSPDRKTRLDFTGGTSKWTSGPLRGNTDFNAGVGFSRFFG